VFVELDYLGFGAAFELQHEGGDPVGGLGRDEQSVGHEFVDGGLFEEVLGVAHVHVGVDEVGDGLLFVFVFVEFEIQVAAEY
jgi:hypothetical protein